MTVETLARLQFALTVMFHYLFAPMSIGISVILVAIEGLYLKTQDIFFKKAAQFLSKIFGIIFIFGVATGIVLEFEFGTNMAAFSQFANEVFAGPLLAEGLFAFFLESIFLGIVLYGWDRVSKKVHFFSTLMVFLGAHLSAVWIVIANAWMQTPSGFTIVDTNGIPHAQITDYWAMLCNPSSPDMIIHTMLGAHLAGAFFIISLCAYYLLKKQNVRFAMTGLKISLGLAAAVLLLQLVSGDSSARCVAIVNPEKLAAFEGIFHSTRNAPLSIVGCPNIEKEKVDYQLAFPGLLSLLAFHTTEAEIRGLDTIPREDWPNVWVVFQSYHLMVAMWALMAITVFLCWRYRTHLLESKWTLRLLFVSALFPQIANQAGWIATEMGRYPWAIYRVLRIQDSISKTVGPLEVASTLAIYILLYSLLSFIFIKLLSNIVNNSGLSDE